MTVVPLVAFPWSSDELLDVEQRAEETRHQVEEAVATTVAICDGDNNWSHSSVHFRRDPGVDDSESISGGLPSTLCEDGSGGGGGRRWQRLEEDS